VGQARILGFRSERHVLRRGRRRVVFGPVVTRPVLLTVSGSIPADLDEAVAAGLRPRTDYQVMAERMRADLVDVDRALSEHGRLGRLLHRVGGAGLLLGWYAFRRRRSYDVVFTDGEQAGIPFALLTRCFGRGGSRHVMIAHVLSVPKKAKLVRWTRIGSRVDRYIAYCSSQAAFLRDALGIPAERVVLTPFMVDTEFFAPEAVDVLRRRMICSAGLERRDYATLVEAVDGLDVEVVITAASLWSKREDSSSRLELPANVTVGRLSNDEFRAMYAASAFVVLPLDEVDFQAGITTMLEAMSMGRAIVCSRIAGQTDTVVDGETGRYVPQGDPAALRAAIVELLDDPDGADRMGANGRQWVLANADVVAYADRLAGVVAEVAAG
jgi:glycosyltransferase involved in cell wall biosynthesis